MGTVHPELSHYPIHHVQTLRSRRRFGRGQLCCRLQRTSPCWSLCWSSSLCSCWILRWNPRPRGLCCPRRPPPPPRPPPAREVQEAPILEQTVEPVEQHGYSIRY